MISLSYTISPLIKKNLETIDELRRDIAVLPLRPHKELELQFDTLVNQIYYSGLVPHNIITRNVVGQFLKGQAKQLTEKVETTLTALKKTHDYVRSDWLSNSDNIRTSTIYHLYKLLSQNEPKKSKLTSSRNTTLDYFLDYLQLYSEHPIIQAALAHIQMLDIDFPKINRQSMAHYLTQIFLYKNGYDFRRIISLERNFYEHGVEYELQISAAKEKGTLNDWLIFFTSTIIAELEKTHAELSRMKETKNTQSTMLSDRQHKLLLKIVHPDMKVTNRLVQKWFRVSQITASRDLAAIARLGLLFQRGKGRSVYYTKV